jgi:predicted protein tyrosine phosphatase
MPETRMNTLKSWAMYLRELYHLGVHYPTRLNDSASRQDELKATRRESREKLLNAARRWDIDSHKVCSSHC